MTDSLIWTLILVQMALGTFDILYHHEGTERLAWRQTQRRELQLHSARNIVYAIVFLALGCVTPRGAWSVCVLALLLTEAAITLWDFVEEDRSRKLPATERITHTLLAINYGVLLSLLVPVLLDWARQPIGLKPVWLGFWSLAAGGGAVAVGVFGVREFFAARRLIRLTVEDPAVLVEALPSAQHVLVTGATGLVGSRLAKALLAAGHSVTVLTRNPEKAARLGAPLAIVTDLRQFVPDARIDAIISLAGEPLADGLWTRAKRRRIFRSRLAVTRDVVGLIERLKEKPKVLVVASAIGWYGLRGDEVLDERAGAEPCFSHRVCAALERMAGLAEGHGVRVVKLRIGLVLATEGGILGRMLVPFEFGLGGRFGSGRQWMSWIHRDDLVRAIAHAVAHPAIRGPVNAVAPNPVPNAEFTRVLGSVLRRPALMRIPAWPLRRALGGLADELLLGGQKVIPAKLKASGFVFRYPKLRGALSGLLRHEDRENRYSDRALPNRPIGKRRECVVDMADHRAVG